MMAEDSKPELTIWARYGRVSIWEKIDDKGFLEPFFEIHDHSLLTIGELLGHAFQHWLRSTEGCRILAIIKGRKEIAAGDWHDMDDVLDEIQAIINGTDTDDDG